MLCTQLHFFTGAGGSPLAGQQDLTPRLTDSTICRQSSAVMSRVEKAAVLILLVTEFTSHKIFSRSLSSHFLGRK